jgi:hypothetical protein
MGNEKAVNQLIAHHSVIFDPKNKIVWVSTSPWQLGMLIAYDLNKVFNMNGLKYNHEINDSLLTIAADSFLNSNKYHDFLKFRIQKQNALDGKPVDVNAIINANPEYYDSYVIAGKYLMEKNQFAKAKSYFETALTKEIATQAERTKIKENIEICINELKNK